jgi:small subunit ribosomal protein S18
LGISGEEFFMSDEVREEETPDNKDVEQGPDSGPKEPEPTGAAATETTEQKTEGEAGDAVAAAKAPSTTEGRASGERKTGETAPSGRTAGGRSPDRTTSGGSRTDRRGDSAPRGRSDRPRGRYGNRPRRYFSKKVCRLCVNKVKSVDYKNVDMLRRFVTERGKILPRRMTGTCARHQRMLCTAIKRARMVALLPFVNK